MNEIKNVSLYDLDPSFDDFFEDEGEVLTVEEYFDPLISADFPENWVWVSTVRTLEDDPEKALLGSQIGFFQALEEAHRLFQTLNFFMTSRGTTDPTVVWDYDSTEGDAPDLDEMISSVYIEVEWEGRPSLLIMEAFRIGRLPLM